MSWIILAAVAWAAFTLFAIALATAAGRGDRRPTAPEAPTPEPAAHMPLASSRFQRAEERPRVPA